jgi:hypothetical protein
MRTSTLFLTQLSISKMSTSTAQIVSNCYGSRRRHYVLGLKAEL